MRNMFLKSGYLVRLDNVKCGGWLRYFVRRGYHTTRVMNCTICISLDSVQMLYAVHMSEEH
jgi:hypothetical protein